MFRTQKKRALERTNFGKEVIREQDYPDRLNMYLIPPLAEITLDEFEEWALDRLRVLSEIETCLFRNRNMKMTEQSVKPLLEKYLPLSPNSVSGRVNKGSQLDTERKKDHYSHFILRLAFCRTEELRRRFVKAETVLFRMRYLSADVAEQHALLARYNFGWTLVPEDEKRSLQEYLNFASSESTYTPSPNESYFTVPFERVPELVESRKVFVKGGVAYVPASQQLSLILTEFSEKLEKALEITARALPRLDEDDRLLPILAHLSKGFVAPEYIPDNSTTAPGHGVVRASQIDSLVPHFPLCMRTLHTALRRDSHLRYFGRQQYGLFLKGIGLSVEEALGFWRSSFSKCTDEKFNKEYRYNIRHNYGLEGNRRNYKPRSCAQILTDAAPGANEHHGCPYRHFSEDNLVAALQGLGVSDQGVLRGVREDVRNKQYHVACTRVFEATHKAPGVNSPVGVGVGMESVTHPNLYYDRSVQFARQVETVDGENRK
ncbi:eukaryotic and archaeal DNA primase, large subunit-domain-containing protein [Lipomyces kononenkoae]|uniref:Eukaryotic and archaeal DNA primase, large subunit-domain-containing protein n=1 Tax=Lipomyces kononenkoae TaxID=34357 RepID=A0ACC3T0C9_LIPKO